MDCILLAADHRYDLGGIESAWPAVAAG